jgi:hypothetical protein
MFGKLVDEAAVTRHRNLMSSSAFCNTDELHRSKSRREIVIKVRFESLSHEEKPILIINLSQTPCFSPSRQYSVSPPTISSYSIHKLLPNMAPRSQRLPFSSFKTKDLGAFPQIEVSVQKNSRLTGQGLPTSAA